MNAIVKLIAFGGVLTLALAVGFGVGRMVGPLGHLDRPAVHAGHVMDDDR